MLAGDSGTGQPTSTTTGLHQDGPSVARAGVSLACQAQVALPARSCRLAESAPLVLWLGDSLTGRSGPGVDGLSIRLARSRNALP